MLAPLPDDVALDMARPLEVLRNDAAVADKGIGLQDDLPRVAGVRQGLHIAAHAGGKDQLPQGPGLAAEPEALEHLAVRQYQIAFLHGCLPCAYWRFIPFIMRVFGPSVNPGLISGRKSLAAKGITFCGKCGGLRQEMGRPASAVGGFTAYGGVPLAGARRPAPGPGALPFFKQGRPLDAHLTFCRAVYIITLSLLCLTMEALKTRKGYLL